VIPINLLNDVSHLIGSTDQSFCERLVASMISGGQQGIQTVLEEKLSADDIAGKWQAIESIMFTYSLQIEPQAGNSSTMPSNSRHHKH
jgi:hypothetical protein